MNWFEQLCRNMGLMIHNVRHPSGPSDRQTHQTKRTVEEQNVSPTVTLRRTTIEEVEVKKPAEEKE